MAKVIGYIQREEVERRIKRSKRVRYSKPLRVQVGPILKEALNGSVLHGK